MSNTVKNQLGCPECGETGPVCDGPTPIRSSEPILQHNVETIFWYYFMLECQNDNCPIDEYGITAYINRVEREKPYPPKGSV